MKVKSIFKQYGILSLIAFFVVGCGSERKREDQVSAIIKKINAPFLVVNASPQNLIDKSGAMDGALPFTQELLLGFFIDESVTGVDYDTDVQIIVAKGGVLSPKVYGIFKIKNEVAFMELMETEANARIEEKDGFSYAVKESDSYVVVWDEEFAIASNIPMGLGDLFGGGSSKKATSTVDKCIALINAAEEEGDEDYIAFLENESDIAIRFKGAGLYKHLSEMTFGESDQLEANKTNMEGINSDMFLNFKPGSIDFQMLNDLSETFKEELAFLKNEGVDSKLMSFGRSTDPIMLMGYNTDLKKAVDYSEDKMAPFDFENVKKELEKMGMTVEDAKNTLTGELLFIMDGVEVKEEVVDWGYGDPYVRKEPMPIFGLALGISDPGALMAILMDSTSGRLPEGPLKSGGAYIAIYNDVLFSTNDSVWAVNVLAGNGVKVNDEAGVLAGNPFGLFVNFASMTKMADLDKEIGPMLGIMKDIRGSGNMDELSMAFTFKDESKNALRILTETISRLMEGEVPEGAEIDAIKEELEAAAAEYEAEHQ